jgi:sodium leak channel non-selective protein
LLLFAISTGEDWNKLMYDCVDTPPNCIPGQTCGSSLAPAYYIIFVLFVSNVMLNLFILVII